MPSTLNTIYQEAQRLRATGRGNCGGDKLLQGTSYLISAFQAQGVFVYSLQEGKEYQVVSKKSIKLKGFLLVQEQLQPPKLKIVKRIQNRSLAKLKELIVKFTRDYSRGSASKEGETVSPNKEDKGASPSNKGEGVSPSKEGKGVGPSKVGKGVSAKEAQFSNNKASKVINRQHAPLKRSIREVANRDKEEVSRPSTGTSISSLFMLSLSK